ncbi:uncharacterized protein [Littorina saxatilis]|uniref:Uncharacterized protein n=1 Tax=Littorina saxatilis TaxID=31220 RepID=A0AAN9G8Y1_9CAEN
MTAVVQTWSVLLLALLLTVISAASTTSRATDNDYRYVNIEGYIDLDSPPYSNVKDIPHPEAEGETDTTVGHGDSKIAPGLGPAPPPPSQVLKSDVIKPPARHVPMTSDDEDVELSGDGSGSGDVAEIEGDDVIQFTKKNVTTTMSQPSDGGVKVDLTTNTPPDVVIGGLEGRDSRVTFKDDVNRTLTSEGSITISDVIYTGADVWPPVPVKEQTDEGEEILLWSPWIRTNDVTEVRIRTCTGSEEACNGTEAELRHCDRESNRCDVNPAVVMSEEEAESSQEECSDSTSQQQDDSDEVVKPVQKEVRPLPPGEIDLERTELEPCTYSLFDLKRGKYLITQWSLTRLVTQAKVKKWCARPQDYLVFHPPHDHCRRYYRDLCHVSTRCKGTRGTPKARGDFAEGCWRQFVYGGQLPVGLSNRQTIVYLICQRYAANSAVGKTFGHKRSHFATLYDTKGRAPVVSLGKLTELGNAAWPNTPYYIEHGLVEDAEDTAWFLRKAKKGMVLLRDMGKCQDEDSCQLGAHQVLPSDYSATTYRVAPLLWPELAGPDPLSITSTFTLTNTAPMHPALYPAWHRAVLQVRHFAVQQCGVPHVSPEDFVSTLHYQGHKLHHYLPGTGGGHVPALYLASGVIPSRDPVETIGNDINVPFMFWMAACCLSDDNSTTTAWRSDTDTNDYRNNDYTNLFHPHHNHHHHHKQQQRHDDDKKAADRNHFSFAIYARNTGSGSAGEGQGEGSRGQVVAAPVLQLEMLLQDIYKTLPTDADVNLFPASRGACSELKNDYSRNVHLQ